MRRLSQQKVRINVMFPIDALRNDAHSAIGFSAPGFTSIKLEI